MLQYNITLLSQVRIMRDRDWMAAIVTIEIDFILVRPFPFFWYVAPSILVAYNFPLVDFFSGGFSIHVVCKLFSSVFLMKGNSNIEKHHRNVIQNVLLTQWQPFLIWWKVHWIAFLRFPLTKSHIGSGNEWFGADQVTSHYMNQWWPISLCIRSSRCVILKSPLAVHSISNCKENY